MSRKQDVFQLIKNNLLNTHWLQSGIRLGFKTLELHKKDTKKTLFWGKTVEVR